MDDLLFNQADLEYNNDNFEKAFELFLKAAENGDDSAMDRIASMYDVGEGVDYDFDKAIYWYQKANKIFHTNRLEDIYKELMFIIFFSSKIYFVAYHNQAYLTQ